MRRPFAAAALLLAVSACNCGGTVVDHCTADTQTDILNCGECGVACDIPVHATRRCLAGVCGRTPCEPGFYDLDESIYGCESRCQDGLCTLADGSVVQVEADPLPESGVVYSTLSSGTSYGGALQTSAHYTHFAVLGESTPPVVGGAVDQQGATHRHQGGFSAVDH